MSPYMSPHREEIKIRPKPIQKMHLLQNDVFSNAVMDFLENDLGPAPS